MMMTLINLDPGTPESQTNSAVKFLLPALSPSRRSRNSEDSQISSEDEDSDVVDSNESNDCFQREVRPLDEARPNPQHTIKTTTSLKGILPAIKSSCGEEKCDTQMSKYNSAIQYEVNFFVRLDALLNYI